MQYRILATLVCVVFFVECVAFDGSAKIPKKIWQTYLTKILPEPARVAQESWLTKNSGYEYALWDDSDIEMYILMRWPREMYDFFRALPLGVMKADLWRYLILKTEGGVYSDIDSICCKSIQNWIKDWVIYNENILLLGLENNVHFCQWTIAATPEHPALEFVCGFLLERWKQRGIDVKNPHFVHATTGPGIWTEALVAYLGEPPKTQAATIFYQYKKNSKYRKKINALGVFLFPVSFYAGEASENLYGSQRFGDGYKRWTEEAALLNEASSD